MFTWIINKSQSTQSLYSFPVKIPHYPSQVTLILGSDGELFLLSPKLTLSLIRQMLASQTSHALINPVGRMVLGLVQDVI